MTPSEKLAHLVSQRNHAEARAFATNDPYWRFLADAWSRRVTNFCDAHSSVHSDQIANFDLSK